MVQYCLRPHLATFVFLSIAAIVSSCGSTSSSSSQAPEVGGNCENTEGDNGSWEITDLPEASEWTRACFDGEELSTTGKFLRFENLVLEEGASLDLMPFSNAEDNGFKISFTHNQVATLLSPVSATPAESFDLDLSEGKTLCVEIHGLQGESHIWGYVKGGDAEACSSSEDRSEPAANWQVDTPAIDLIGGRFIGFMKSGSVTFDRIVITNRSGGTEAGNPSL